MGIPSSLDAALKQELESGMITDYEELLAYDKSIQLNDIWYLQSGNYLKAKYDAEGKVTTEGTGMKIDLGLGLIDAYNFKLTSKNVLIDSTKDAKVYFEIKA
jgi:hypothetical protein